MKPMLDGTPVSSSTPSPKPGVLILGASVGALAAARSLGRAGVPVWLLADGAAAASLSRYVVRALRWTGPGANGALVELLALADRYELKGWMLIAAGDAEMRLLARHHREISKVFQTTVPGHDVIRWADDKVLTYSRAQQLGIDTPRLYSHRGLDDIRQLDCVYPVILKPAVHAGLNRFTLAKAWIANDRIELLARYEDAVSCVEPRHVIVQEMIPGDGSTQFSYAGVWQQGQAVASLVATRSRQYPIRAGYTSTFVQVVENTAVKAAAEKFLQSIGYSGLVEVEFKYDNRDQKYKILDVNTRLWTWVGLGAAAQLDFPMMLYKLVTGEEVRCSGATVGQAWTYGSRDVISALHEIRVGRLTWGEYFRQKRAGVTPAVFALDDPLPAIAELPIVAYRVVTRRVLGSRRGTSRHRPQSQAQILEPVHSTDHT